MRKKGLNTWPSFTQKESKEISKVLMSNKVNYWTGEQGKKFEEDFSSWIGSNYAVTLANGTLALDLALKTLNLGKSDEVIVTPRSFIASASCVVNIGAKPVFADVDRDSGNITAESISKVITSKTKAVICVHLAGWPCEMTPIMELSRKHNFFVIEDCAQAHGASYRGKNVGSIGDIGAWSFCQDKIITTGGEGGMITTNDKKLWEKMWSYRDHGKSLDAVYTKDHSPGFKWLHESFGSNFRMTEIQAAIGRIQLKKLLSWHRTRSDNATLLTKVCDKCHNLLRTPVCPKDSIHAFYKFYTYVKPEGLEDGWNRDKIISEINKLGVPCFSGSCSEIYLEAAFDKTTFRPKQRLSVAKELGETSLVFLVHPSLTKKDINKITNTMNEVFRKASRS